MRITEIYLIAPEKLTFEIILDYFESRVIFLQSCVSFGRQEYQSFKRTELLILSESIKRGSPDKYSPQLSMLYWGPCKESPVIMSPPEDSYGPLGANLTLDCEARGFPAPTITWQFLSTDGKTISLPSGSPQTVIE